MPLPTQVVSPAAPAHPAARAIFLGGLICGVLDLAAALLIYGAMGAAPLQILQGIASGLVGARAFSAGSAGAALGLVLEFVISWGAAAVYVAASHLLPILLRRAALAGPLYGLAVYWFMQLVVLPLSRYHGGAFSWKLTLIGMAIHVVCVGPPIALAARRQMGSANG
ncbi:MAG: hypothetical protein ACLGSD_07280 [Acidobacteriota bacterium]